MVYLKLIYVCAFVMQSIPRTVELDEKTRTNLIQWPVVEIETLRINSTDLGGTTIDTGSVLPLPLRRATQLDIEATFHLDTSAIAAVNEAESATTAAPAVVLPTVALSVLSDSSSLLTVPSRSRRRCTSTCRGASMGASRPISARTSHGRR
uniref:Uncharacterized protein n=1 Tax=Triticum urartu TaxID=4572 RepID=A0A8R7VJQ5_TRIUA